MLLMSNPELNEEWGIIDDDWGLISIYQGDVLLGLEFVESETSWAKDERLLLYKEAQDMGFSVVVIVPQQVYLRLSERLRSLEWSAPFLLSYDAIGITQVPRPS